EFTTESNRLIAIVVASSCGFLLTFGPPLRPDFVSRPWPLEVLCEDQPERRLVLGSPDAQRGRADPDGDAGRRPGYFPSRRRAFPRAGNVRPDGGGHRASPKHRFRWLAE